MLVILLSSKSVMKHFHLYGYAIIAHGVTRFIMGQGVVKRERIKKMNSYLLKEMRKRTHNVV